MDYLPSRKFMRLGDWLTLAGMGFNVASASSAWGSQHPKLIDAATAIYIKKIGRVHNGFDFTIGKFSVGWIIVFAALTAASLLLWDAYGEHRIWMQRIHAGTGILTLVLALLHIGPYLGVWLAIAGGGLLLYSGMERYRLK